MTQAASLAGAPTVEIGDGLPVPRRYWAHLAVGLAVMMSTIDSSIANVALPTIARDLNASPAASIWVVNAYQLSVCMSLLILGSLGDIYGYGRVYRVCLTLFTIASLGCALSHSLTGLAVARFVQGIGGAGVIGVTNAMLRGIYPRSQLAFGIGRNTLIVALSLALGPTVASFILSIATWPWLFAVNVPIGIFTLLIAGRTLPAFPRSNHSFDRGSAGLSALTFGLLILGVDGLGHGQAPAGIAAELIAGFGAGYVLVRRQASLTSPLLPVDLLKIRLFTLSVSTTFLASMAQLMAYVAIPFLFEHALGRSQVETGYLITPWPVMVGLIAPVAGRLAGRVSPGALAAGGLVTLAVGLTLVSLLPEGAGTIAIVACMMLSGLGYGIFLPPNASTQIGAVPRQRSGGASTMGATGRVFGQSIGAAMVAALFGLRPQDGAEVALMVAAGIAVCGAAISMLRTTPAASPAAQRGSTQ
jgi:DHA2 family multidrug resistance protein-like MFS transporter